MNSDIIPDTPESNKIKNTLKALSRMFRKHVFVSTKSKCPNCREENTTGSRLVMQDFPGITPTYQRICIKCGHKWTTPK